MNYLRSALNRLLDRIFPEPPIKETREDVMMARTPHKWPSDDNCWIF